MATTAFGFPYPVLGDDVDVPDDIKKLADQLQAHLDFPVCKLLLPSNFPVANSSNAVTVPFGTGSEMIKTHPGMHSVVTNNTRIIPGRLGIYLLQATVTFAVNTSGFRAASIGKNGVRQGGESGIYVSASLPSGSNATIPPIVTFLTVTNVNDYFELFTFQNSGGPLNVVGTGVSTDTGNTSLSCAYLRPLP